MCDDKREIIIIYSDSRGGVTNDILAHISYSHIQLFPYWCHDGKRIVPVTVQVWDCLSSPGGAALDMERVGDGSVGAIDISRSRCLVS